MQQDPPFSLIVVSCARLDSWQYDVITQGRGHLMTFRIGARQQTVVYVHIERGLQGWKLASRLARIRDLVSQCVGCDDR